MKNLIKKIKRLWWRSKSVFVKYYYGNPAEKLKIVGVTGTNGKTTTVTLLYKITIALGYKAGLISTVETLINGEKRNMASKAPAPGTTPDSISLTKIFAEMVASGCEYVFMEVSSHAMDQGRVAGIKFTGGIFTNLTHDHLDYHKNFQNYFEAKKKFFRLLPPNAFALANADDAYGKKMLENISARRFLYEFKDIDAIQSLDQRFVGEIIKIDFSGLELKFGNTIIKSKLLGKFNAYNLLSVWSACNLLGFNIKEVNKILESIDPPKGRFEHFTSPSGIMVIVDYAHTPDALEKILGAVKEVAGRGGRLISLFGCGGDRDPLKRSIMGKIGTEMSDIAIFTSDNPRSEDPDKIIEQMKTDLSPLLLEKVITISNRREAILEAVKIAQRGDVIVAAGKGHEDYQEIKGVKHHFDDMEEFRKAFK